jgi:predicted Holliday junction resolvase-like endonuclease
MITLDIIITVGWFTIICIILFFVLFGLISSALSSDKERNSLRQKLKENEILMQKNDAELKVQYQNWALTELEKFKQNEILKVQKTAEEQAINAASVILQKWKIENEAYIRQDAINRSYAVNLGKITEHLVPFHLKFPFNPKDVRFIGSPIDLIVFDGHSEKNDDIVIWIVEVKTGNSRLTEGQVKIKKAVQNAQIRWYEINPDDENANEIITNKIENNKTVQLTLFEKYPDDLWDNAIDITAQSVEDGNEILESMNIGIEYIRRSDWYKNLSNDRKKKAEDQFINIVKESAREA